MTSLPPEITLPLLMDRLEALLDVLDEHHIAYWFDWGTLLGYHRHGNVIPWDYDVDMCLLEEDYARLQAVFAAAGGRIGKLGLDLDYYGEPKGACFIPLDEDPKRYHGIDLVSYRRGEGRVTTLMSPELIAQYPLDYDFPEEVVFPLNRGHFLGRRILVPANGEARLRHSYGEWQRYPEGQSESRLTPPPFRPLALPATSAEKRASAHDTLWVILAEDLAELGKRGIERGALEGRSFTELVFLADHLLWGRILVGSVPSGKPVPIPDGAWVARRQSRSVRFEVAP